MTNAEQVEAIKALEKLTKSDKETAKLLTSNEARFLVDNYYQTQKMRITLEGQLRSIEQGCDDSVDAHNLTLELTMKDYKDTEGHIKTFLDYYTDSKPIGRWMKDICGIGPVIAAGLIAHIDITRVQTAGQIQRFAGLDPTVTWNKGEKRPWNAKLKTLCWKIGQSFVKVSNNPKDVYGKIYKEKKAYYIAKNEAGGFKDRAAQDIKKYAKNTDAYKACAEGKLPLGNIESMAQRFAVKIFLSHLFTVWYEMENGVPAPKPYAEAVLNHAHIIAPPKYDDFKQYLA